MARSAHGNRHTEACASLTCPCYVEGSGDGVRAAQRAAAELPPTMDGLLTEEEHADLSADLARMANQRRRVEAESRDVPLGLYCGTCGSERIFPIPQLPDEPTPAARGDSDG